MLVTMPCILIDRAEVSQSFVLASINNLHIKVILLSAGVKPLIKYRLANAFLGFYVSIQAYLEWEDYNS